MSNFHTSVPRSALLLLNIVTLWDELQVSVPLDYKSSRPLTLLVLMLQPNLFAHLLAQFAFPCALLVISASSLVLTPMQAANVAYLEIPPEPS